MHVESRKFVNSPAGGAWGKERGAEGKRGRKRERARERKGMEREMESEKGEHGRGRSNP